MVSLFAAELEEPIIGTGKGLNPLLTKYGSIKQYLLLYLLPGFTMKHMQAKCVSRDDTNRQTLQTDCIFVA